MRRRQPDVDQDGITLWVTCRACPVQLEGTVDGYPAYFRARGRAWRFTLAMIEEDAIQPERAPVGRLLFSAGGEYDEDGCGSCAGYLSLEMAGRLIGRSVEAFRSGDTTTRERANEDGDR